VTAKQEFTHFRARVLLQHTVHLIDRDLDTRSEREHGEEQGEEQKRYDHQS